MPKVKKENGSLATEEAKAEKMEQPKEILSESGKAFTEKKIFTAGESKPSYREEILKFKL
jgi:hypothetical protein